MPIHVQKAVSKALPNWVPVDVQNYLLHTETGLAIRYLARQKGCHASTVLRQIRRLEHRRDDPLVDAALSKLGKKYFQRSAISFKKEPKTMSTLTASHLKPKMTERYLSTQFGSCRGFARLVPSWLWPTVWRKPLSCATCQMGAAQKLLCSIPHLHRPLR